MTKDEWAARVPAESEVQFYDVAHVVVVPNYAEPVRMWCMRA